MDRRDFLKKTAMVAAGTAIAAPVSAMLTKAESAGLLENETAPQPATVNAGKPKVLLVNLRKVPLLDLVPKVIKL